tara:strand:- start:245091 stop:245732 length:642 start_codon:yes stop_codon:yes gene_type:complete
MVLQVVSASGTNATLAAQYVPDLVFATGPKSYDYIFGGRGGIYDPFMAAAWAGTGNFFSHAQSYIALEDGAFRGVLISHDGPDHYRLKDAVWPVAMELLAAEVISEADLTGLAERADLASYMNPHVPDDCSYIIVVSVPQEARGKGAGRALMEHEIGRARAKGFRTVHLDVMSDNPAVGLYSALGFEVMAETVTPVPCRQHGIAMEYRMVLAL